MIKELEKERFGQFTDKEFRIIDQIELLQGLIKKDNDLIAAKQVIKGIWQFIEIQASKP